MLVASPAVALVLAGHDHEGGYAIHDGIHWLTLPALLEGEARIQFTSGALAAQCQLQAVCKGLALTS